MFDKNYISFIEDYQEFQSDKDFIHYLHVSEEVKYLYHQLFNSNSSIFLNKKVVDNRFNNLFNLLSLKNDFIKDITTKKIDFLSNFILNDDF